MKRPSVFIFSMILFTVAVYSCSSMGRNEAQPAEEEITETKTAEAVSLPSGWEYQTEITHEGSRSEGSVSRLFYRYNEVPPVFNFIMVGTRIFEYIPMKNLWDNWGYVESMLPSRPECIYDDPVSSEELRTGWYTDQVRQFKAGTPSEWIYIEAAGIKGWCAPEKISDFADYFNLNEISAGPALISRQ